MSRVNILLHFSIGRDIIRHTFSQVQVSENQLHQSCKGVLEKEVINVLTPQGDEGNIETKKPALIWFNHKIIILQLPLYQPLQPQCLIVVGER